MHTIIIGLGSNLGQRQVYLDHAIEQLRASLHDIHLSPVYESPALLLPGSPEEWDVPFLNMALMGKTSLSPEELLLEAKRIEQEMGRETGKRWSPREIDIDLLAWGNDVIRTPTLSIPHISLLERDFALLPLADLWPHWHYPVPGEHFGKTAAQLAVQLSSVTAKRL